MLPIVYDPKLLIADRAYRSLDRGDRGLLRDVMDATWGTPGHWLVDCELGALSGKIRREDIRDAAVLLRRLCDEEKRSLVRQEWDIISGKDCFLFPFLRRADEAARQRRRSGSRSSKNDFMLSKMGSRGYYASGGRDEAALTASVSVVGSDQMDADSFQGWLPTMQFAERGEVYRPTQDYADHLGAEFPNVSIADELVRMWDWLNRHPEFRPTATSFDRYLYRWMSKASIRNAQSTVVSDAAVGTAASGTMESRLSDYFDGLVNSSNGGTAS